jgi:hypothetical protein
MTPDAVKAIVDRAPELTDDQRARIRAILLPGVPTTETLVPTEYDDGPGTRRGRRDHLAAAKEAKGRSQC